MQSIAISVNKNKTIPPVVREYDIDGMKYIVSATTKAGASEDAATKVRRMIKKEISEIAVK